QNRTNQLWEVAPQHAYSRRQGESVTRRDRRRREFKLGNSSPTLARLRESNGVVTREGLAEQGGRAQSAKPFLKLGPVNPSLPFEMSCFANSTTCPVLLAPRQSIDGFKRLQRIGNDAAANNDLVGCAHKISGWPRKGTKGAKEFSPRFHSRRTSTTFRTR